VLSNWIRYGSSRWPRPSNAGWSVDAKLVRSGQGGAMEAASKGPAEAGDRRHP
jgi:hypothetical protein